MSQLTTSTRYALLSFRRNPAATFFTVVFPIIFLVLFGYIFGSDAGPGERDPLSLLVPGILALSVVSATFVNLAITTVFRRESGELKRVQGTPLHPVIYIGAQIIASFVITMFMTVLMVVLGRILFDVAFNLDTTFVFVATLFIAASAFCALGLALTVIIPNEKAAPAFTNIITLPLYFVSDVFFPLEDAPSFIQRVGDFFPIKHLVLSLQDAFDPNLVTVDIPWNHWAVMAGWGVLGVVVAAKKFRWTAS